MTHIAFILPTQIPATIEANLALAGDPTTLRLWTDGQTQRWINEHGAQYTPEQVMTAFTNHAIKEG